MTEKEFDQQVWRRHDTVTLDTGLETTIMNLSFSSRSVRVYLKNSPPEWMGCDRIVSHKSRVGGDADDLAIVEELHNKVLKQQERIERLQEEKRELIEKNGKVRINDLLRAVNMVHQGITEKKSKIEKIEQGLEQITLALEKMEE